MKLDEVFADAIKSELSMIEVAHAILDEKGEKMAFVDIVNEIQTYLGKSDSEVRDRLPQFYTDLNEDGAFISLGDNVWGLRAWYPYESVDEEVNQHDEEDDAPRRKKRKKVNAFLADAGDDDDVIDYNDDDPEDDDFDADDDDEAADDFDDDEDADTDGDDEEDDLPDGIEGQLAEFSDDDDEEDDDEEDDDEEDEDTSDDAEN